MDREKIFRELIAREARPIEGRDYAVIPLRTCRDIASGLGMTYREAEIAALRMGVCPSRYERNMGTIGLAGQIKLLESHVAVVGLGGLGGLIADLLARAGVGHMVLIDCVESDIGRGKAEVAFERTSAVNDALDIEVIALYIESEEDAEAFLSSAELVVDALDNNTARKIVSACCTRPRRHRRPVGTSGRVRPGRQNPLGRHPRSPRQGNGTRNRQSPLHPRLLRRAASVARRSDHHRHRRPQTGHTELVRPRDGGGYAGNFLTSTVVVDTNVIISTAFSSLTPTSKPLISKR